MADDEEVQQDEFMSCGHPRSALRSVVYIAGVHDGEPGMYSHYCGICEGAQPQELAAICDTGPGDKPRDVVCPACDGKGYQVCDMREVPYWIEPCDVCNGRGSVPESALQTEGE
jgi:hypothetical protein